MLQIRAAFDAHNDHDLFNFIHDVFLKVVAGQTSLLKKLKPLKANDADQRAVFTNNISSLFRGLFHRRGR
jgi:hypothetical protein